MRFCFCRSLFYPLTLNVFTHRSSFYDAISSFLCCFSFHLFSECLVHNMLFYSILKNYIVLRRCSTVSRISTKDSEKTNCTYAPIRKLLEIFHEALRKINVCAHYLAGTWTFLMRNTFSKQTRRSRPSSTTCLLKALPLRPSAFLPGFFRMQNLRSLTRTDKKCILTFRLPRSQLCLVAHFGIGRTDFKNSCSFRCARWCIDL